MLGKDEIPARVSSSSVVKATNLRTECKWGRTKTFPYYSRLPLLRTPSGEDLVSVITRVRKSGVREKKNVLSFKNLRNDMENSQKPCSFDNSLLLYLYGP